MIEVIKNSLDNLEKFYAVAITNNFNLADIDPDYAYPKIQIALKKKEYIMTDQQLKLLKDRRTPAQIKYEKKGFKLKF